MKRITALLITALMLLSSITAIAAATFSVEPISVTYADSAVQSNSITVKGRYDKPLVLRVFDQNGLVIHIDTTDSDNGEFAFDAFTLKQPSLSGVTGTKSGNTTTYDLQYRFVISDDTGRLNANADAVTVKYAVTSSSGRTSTTTTAEQQQPTPPWDDPVKTNPSQETGDRGKEAYNDPHNIVAIEGAAKQTTAAGGANYVKATTAATDPAAMKLESVRNTIAISVETMMANISSKRVRADSSSNELVLKETSVSDSDLKKYADTEKTLMDSVSENKITLNRDLNKEYIVNTSFKTTSPAKITIYKKFVEKLEKAGIETLTINDSNFRVSYTMTELNEMLGGKDVVSFEINMTNAAGSTKKLTVNFDTDKTQTVKISFPGLSGDSKYMAIVDENGNPVGGRYNPATGAIEAKISESGAYQIVNNEKDFDDIKHLSEEMQESIKILAAKGIIEGTSAREFSPEDSISRAEVAALLLRLLSQIDPNADGEFADVKKSDWFYGTAGSAKNYGMILGFEDNTFRGNMTIAKDQILTVSSRILKREMKYKTPENISEWLTFADAGKIAGWAREDIALAAMANIITRSEDNRINSSEDMTRGDAALIIMRLFYKIW